MTLTTKINKALSNARRRNEPILIHTDSTGHSCPFTLSYAYAEKHAYVTNYICIVYPDGKVVYC